MSAAQHGPASWLQDLIAEDPNRFERARLHLDVTDAIRVALEDAGISQRELAKRLERSPAVVSRTLGEGSNPSIKTLCDYAYALGMRVEVTLSPLDSRGGMMEAKPSPSLLEEDSQ